MTERDENSFCAFVCLNSDSHDYSGMDSLESSLKDQNECEEVIRFWTL